jgi:predicted SAM-dependent methyltransferase
VKISKSLKKMRKFLITNSYLSFKASINKIGNKHKCYICGRTFSYFARYRKGSASIPPFVKELRLIGSDVDNHKCIFCNSHDRERHLYMFFDKLNLWEDFTNAVILHIAPERNLPSKIIQMKPNKYIMGDLYSKNDQIKKIDATNIDFSDGYFDFVLCNHVFEHIINDNLAMKEIFRVLKEGGKAILQTPFSSILRNSFEDANINSEELRLRFYGETSHCRVYGYDFFDKLERVGFKLNIIRNDKYLIFVRKPFNENKEPTRKTRI